MIFFKPKKIVVDVFTDNASVYHHHPLIKTKKSIPDWWKKLPAFNQRPVHDMHMEEPTIKKCVGLISHFQQGYILPSWTDIQIKTTDVTYSYKVALSFIEPALQHHEKWQYGQEFENFIHLKIVSPWFLKTKTDVNFMCVEPTWNIIDHWNNFRVLPGVVDFKYQSSINVNLFLQKNKEKIFIDAGTPLYHIIPLSDREVEMKLHLVDTKEMNKIFVETRYGTFHSSWKHVKNNCPYSTLWKK